MYIMSFPHAAKGIKMIFIAEMLALFSWIVLGIVFILTGVNKEALSAESSAGLATGLAISLFSAGALFCVGFVLKIIGYFQTARDEEGFTRAIILAIITVVLLIVANILQPQNNVVMQWIYTVVLVAAETTHMVVIVSAIGGMVNLSYKCRDEGLVRRGNTIIKIVSAIYALNIVLIILNRILFFINPDILKTFNLIIKLLVAVLTVIQYILYITYLANVSSMLKES